jgi:hypothetical protein
MATENMKPKSKLQGGECVSIPVPAGTKSRGRLPRPGDPEPSLVRIWWPIGAAIIATLGIGVLIGRFLLGLLRQNRRCLCSKYSNSALSNPTLVSIATKSIPAFAQSSLYLPRKSASACK